MKLKPKSNRKHKLSIKEILFVMSWTMREGIEKVLKGILRIMEKIGEIMWVIDEKTKGRTLCKDIYIFLLVLFLFILPVFWGVMLMWYIHTPMLWFGYFLYLFYRGIQIGIVLLILTPMLLLFAVMFVGLPLAALYDGLKDYLEE